MEDRNRIPQNDNMPEEAEAARYAAPEIEDDDDDTPTEWVPTRFEKKINAIPEKTWKTYQILGGGAIGAFTVFALFFGGEGLNPLFLIAMVLALFVPRYLEDQGRRKLLTARVAMVVVIAVGLVVFAIYMGTTEGWHLFKQDADAAARIVTAYMR